MATKEEDTTETLVSETADALEAPRVRAPAPLDVPEPLVKKRRTKNFQLREEIAKSKRTTIVNVPAFEPRTFDTWEAFIQAWTEYMSRTKTLYRRRSSSTTTYWNSKHRFKKYPVPETFQYATMAYWCTHGCIQPSRGNGVRTHLHNRYTGCSARITADVVCEPVEGEPGKLRWLVRVRNQIAQHNHRISDEIYHCYASSNSVPDELLLGRREEESEQQQSTESEEPDFEPSARILTELDPQVGVDGVPGFTTRSVAGTPLITDIPTTVSRASGKSSAAAMSNVPGILMKEVLANDQKLNMASSELQPIIEELQNTSSRVIHKRLQDVSEMVAHLLGKWHQDRIAEEAAQVHSITPLSADHAAASSSELLSSKTPPTAISTISGLPAGASFYLAQRVDQITSDGGRAASSAVSNNSGSGDDATPTQNERELSGKDDQVLEQQRGHSEAV